MTYKNIVSGRFISRPNRFIAKVNINGQEETVHVKNTGRCKELLIPGCKVFLAPSENPNRKTKFDLIAVIKKTENKEILINMDSQIPNLAAVEWLKKGTLFSKEALIKREVTFKNSRFDLYIEDDGRKAFIEVKGVTLENNGTAMFPDAPTIRGVKHINELIEAAKEGYEAYVLFVIQMKGAKEFKPNNKTHKEFGEALKRAYASGVKILAYDCNVTPSTIEINSPIKTNI
ncbi:MAG: DNA/RNA nuclease SfsA [Clostridia bacterium]|nr:DNA/RNA nuclease SfsA [Clostridia bacterium]